MNYERHTSKRDSDSTENLSEANPQQTIHAAPPVRKTTQEKLMEMEAKQNLEDKKKYDASVQSHMEAMKDMNPDQLIDQVLQRNNDKSQSWKGLQKGEEFIEGMKRDRFVLLDDDGEPTEASQMEELLYPTPVQRTLRPRKETPITTTKAKRRPKPKQEPELESKPLPPAQPTEPGVRSRRSSLRRAIRESVNSQYAHPQETPMSGAEARSSPSSSSSTARRPSLLRNVESVVDGSEEMISPSKHATDSPQREQLLRSVERASTSSSTEATRSTARTKRGRAVASLESDLTDTFKEPEGYAENGWSRARKRRKLD
ncbi:hypothetical protein F5Y18DRAFT_96558 [Xylariaceae sp. FL1019]|nr:hypothetical protein F5Y18DRAFT_96558 [Xylariaceae sp. FL1019]